MSNDLFRENPLKANMRNGVPSFGSGIRWPSVELAEFCGFCGFEWLFIDIEHGQFDLESLANVVRACELSGMVPIARIAKPTSHEQVLPYLETGVMGIILSHAETKEDIELIVDAVKYPPLGKRGAGMVRPARWGHGITSLEYAEYANRNTMVIALVESEPGIENLPEILAVPDLDAVVIGYGDLAVKMGISGKKDPRMKEIGKRANALILESGKALQVTVQDGDEARKAVEEGALLVRCSSQELLSIAAHDWLKKARGEQ